MHPNLPVNRLFQLCRTSISVLSLLCAKNVPHQAGVNKVSQIVLAAVGTALDSEAILSQVLLHRARTTRVLFLMVRSTMKQRGGDGCTFQWSSCLAKAQRSSKRNRNSNCSSVGSFKIWSRQSAWHTGVTWCIKAFSAICRALSGLVHLQLVVVEALKTKKNTLHRS